MIDFAIIGAGINGLLIAYELSEQFGDKDIVVFEKEKYCGEHQTSRNSGVLHAGIYYPTDSLKRRFCIEGNKLWRDLARKLQVDVNNCGKYIIASTKDELEDLDLYYMKALENGVSGIRWASEGELEKLRNVAYVENGFFSETTAVLDVSSAIKNLENELFKKNIPLLLENEVRVIEKIEGGFFLKTDREELHCKVLINAGGIHAVDNRKKLGLKELENYWVKGNYLKVNKKFYNEHLIYPVPLKDLKGLGVHTSFDLEGKVRFGPNTEDVDSINYGLADSLIEELIPSINRVFKGLSESDLSLDYSGIRAKVKCEGSPYHDFWIKGPKDHDIQNYIELCAMDSPGLTSAPAVSKYVLKLIEDIL